MTLTTCTPRFSRLPPPPRSPSSLPQLCETCALHCGNTSFLPHLLGCSSVSFNISKFIKAKASVSESDHEISANNVSELLDQELLVSVAAAKDADEALQIIAEKSRRDEGVVCTTDCCSIIVAALNRNNAELALSVFFAMRSSFNQVAEKGPLVERWKWSRPNAHAYTLLIQGLASSLRVSDALRVIKYICEVAVSPGEEVPFGKIVRCPSCRIAVAVAQPQQGIQLVSCAKCRYQYELVSGDIISIQSEEISMDITPWERGLKFLQLKKRSIPAAVHSIVVQTPSGMARTHRFATETVDVPAQVGERVTVAVAAPSNVYRELPQGSVEAIAIKQQLLSQYDVLQSRIKDLKEASEKEVWMLARMCQLENKISVVGEPSYRARKSRIKRVQESLQKSLRGRIELIDSYARISSMIEIEVEMDTDVPAAETVSNADNIMEQIQQIMELENLEERWKIQAEANDEAERLLSSQSLPYEEV